MRTVNVRLMGWLLLAVAILGTGAYFLHGFQMQRSSAGLLREAKAAQGRGDIVQAVDYFQRYLGLVRNKDVDSLAEFGWLLADQGSPADAFRTFEGVLRQDPSREKVRRRQVEMAMAIGRHADAADHLQVLLEQSPDDGKLIAQRAQCEAALAKHQAAVASYRLAIEQSPTELANYSGLAELMQRSLKDTLGAQTVLNEMVQANSKSASAYVLRGTFLLEHAADIRRAEEQRLSEQQLSENAQHRDLPSGEASTETKGKLSDTLRLALADANMAYDLADDQEDVLVFATRCYVANDLAEQAREVAQRTSELFPRNPLLYTSLAELELKAGDIPAAIQWYERGLAAIPAETDLLWNLTAALIDAGREDEAEQSLKQLRTTTAPRPTIAFLEAKALFARKSWLEASQKLEEIRVSLVEWPDLLKQADFLLGQCYQQLGRDDLQLAAFQRASRVDPTWIAARLSFADSLLSAGKLDEALGEYRQILTQPRFPVILLAKLTRLLILLNLQNPPSEQNWREPGALLDQLSQVAPDSSAVAILRAEMLLAQGMNQEAEQTLISARDQAPQTLDYWLALIALEQRIGNTSKAEQLLTEAKSSQGDHVQLRVAEARYLAATQGGGAQEKLHSMAISDASLSEDDQLGLYAELASLAFSLGDYEEAERLCTLVAEKQPANLRIQLLIFDLALLTGRAEVMQQVLDHVRRIEGPGPLWHYGEAVRLTVRAQRENRPEDNVAAKSHLQTAGTLRPTWPRVPMLLARISLAQGDEEVAITNYLEAIKRGERDSAALSPVVTLLSQRRRFEEADQVIRTLQAAQAPFSRELQQMATIVSLQLNDRERALSFVTGNSAASASLQDLLFEGRTLGALGKLSEAEVRFRQAVGLDQTSSDAWLALIQHLVRARQDQKAQEAFAEAEMKIGPFASALALELLGRHAEAEAKYASLLEASPTDLSLRRRVVEFYVRQRKFDAAEPLIRQVLDSFESATDDDRVWARRILAFVVMSRGSNSSVVKDALALIEENLSLNSASVADLRAKGMLLSLTPDRKKWEQAVEILESLDSKNVGAVPGSELSMAEARFVLAQLYVRLDAPKKALTQLQDLMATNGNEPRYLQFYVDLLLRRNEAEEAAFWVDKLVQFAPRQFSTVALATEVEFARQRYDKLMETVDKYLSHPADDIKSQNTRDRQVALLLDQYASRIRNRSLSDGDPTPRDPEWATQLRDRAENLLKSALLSDDPQGALPLAAFYSRSGRFREALNLLEQSWKTAQPEDIVAVTSSLMVIEGATQEDFSQARRLLELALDERGRANLLIMALADLENWTEQYAEAEQLYREAMDASSESPNPVAMNNLAVLLALRGRGGSEALQLIENAIALLGPDPSLIDSRATVFLMAGNPPRAAKDMAFVLSKRPTAVSYFHESLVRRQLGDKEAARESLQKAIESGLSGDKLHPLERPMFRQLQAELIPVSKPD